MSSPADTPVIRGLNLLLFSVGGVHFGVDADQVERSCPCRDTDDPDLRRFHEELQYGRAVAYGEPVVLTVRGADPAGRRVVIDRMEDVAAIAVEEIRPLPPLVEPFALRKGIWGVVARGGRMILLVDLFRLLRGKETDPQPHLPS